MKKRVMFLLLVTVMLLSSLTVFAGSSSLEALKQLVVKGEYLALDTSDPGQEFAANQYKVSDGGYLLYSEITDTENWVNENNLNKLTQSGKMKFAEDMFRVANRAVQVHDAQGMVGDEAITTETVSEMYDILQNKEGMGTVLMASLLSETKPDYAAANKLYEPFSGVVGTILGLLSVLIIALLGVTMGLDIAFIVIPAFQMFCGGAEGSGGEGGGKDKGFLAGLISKEAHWAVAEAQGSSGSGGQSGSAHKVAVGVYLKYRWIGLAVLGICLLYLVGGQIYSFVAWFVNLFSGTLGF